MGDLSSEPSMEDILSSIKRIIAEEGEATPGRGRRAGRPTPPAPVDEEVLELSDPMPQERPADAIRAEPARRPERAEAEPDRAPVAREPERVADRAAAAKPVETAPPTLPERVEPAAQDDPMVSADTVQATRGALDQLSRLLVKPEPGADGTLEGLVREMLRPMVRDWLDANLPALVEDMVAREIQKITSSRR